MVVCCQNLMLGALSSRSAHSALVGMLFKKFSLFLNTRFIEFSLTDVLNSYSEFPVQLYKVSVHDLYSTKLCTVQEMLKVHLTNTYFLKD
jgi:hypothetical protein